MCQAVLIAPAATGSSDSVLKGLQTISAVPKITGHILYRLIRLLSTGNEGWADINDEKNRINIIK